MSYNFIGEAPIIGEGVSITPDLLTQDTKNLEIVKVAKAVELTDESVKSAYSNPIAEAENQLVQAISSGIEREMVTAFATAELGFTTEVGTGLTGAGILAGLDLFGEAQEGEKFLVINPALLSTVRMDNFYENGKVFDLDLVVSNRIPVGTAYILKRNALALFLAKSVDVEQDRDILAKTTVLSGSAHFATTMYDMSKAVKITIA